MDIPSGKLLSMFRSIVAIREPGAGAGRLRRECRIPGVVRLHVGQRNRPGRLRPPEPCQYLTTTHRGHATSSPRTVTGDELTLTRTRGS